MFKVGERFKTSKSLPLHGKLVAWFAIVWGVVTIFNPLINDFTAIEPFPYAYQVLSVIIGFTSIYAAIHIFQDKQWAFWLFCFLYLILSVEYFSSNFSFSLFVPVSFKYHLNWLEPTRVLRINFFTLIPIFIANSNITRLMKVSDNRHLNKKTND